MNQQEAPRAVTVCRLRAGRTMKEKMSYGNINKSTVYDVERMFEHFQNKYENIVSKDALRYPEIDRHYSFHQDGTPAHDSKRMQDWLKEVWVEGGLASQLA